MGEIKHKEGRVCKILKKRELGRFFARFELSILRGKNC
jgi:hypothetical protein